MQTAWLIEDGESEPMWLTVCDTAVDRQRPQDLESVLVWTRDSAEALRFACEESAEAIAEMFGLEDAVVTEHSWYDPTRIHAPGSGDVVLAAAEKKD